MLIKRVCRRVSESRVYSPVCIFCDKIKYLKSTKSREKLTKAVQLRADKTLRECAIKKKDEKILAVTSREIVAAEAHYHISCYKKYTKLINAKDEENDGEIDYQIVEKAFDDLFEFIRTDIILSKKIVPVTFLAYLS